MERKKRSKGSLWEFCYANKIFGTFGDEIKACGQKLVKFCAHTHAAKLVVEMLMCAGNKLKLNVKTDTIAFVFGTFLIRSNNSDASI